MMRRVPNYRFLSLALCFFLSQAAISQQLSINVSNTSFNVNSASQLTTGSINQSAFALVVESGNNAYSLYAAVTAKNFNPSSATFAQIPFTVNLRSINGGGSINDHVRGDIQLTESPAFATLALNAQKTTKNKSYTLNYDINLLPLPYTTPPGTYVFTVTIQYNDGLNNILQNFNISLTVQSILSFSLVQNQSTTANFNSSSAYANGITVNNFHTSQVRSNNPWVLSVSAASAFFTPGSAEAGTNMPCEVVGLRVNGAPSFIQLATTAATLRTGTAGDINVGNNTTNYDMRFTPGWNYNPGIYNLSITYTVTNQ